MKTKIVFAFLGLLALASCKEVSTPGGVIPAPYLSLAQTYTGTFTGDFAGNPGTFVISIDTASKAHLDFQTALVGASSDILDPKCQSQIGGLRAVTVSDDGTQLEVARFTFDPNHCANWIDGRIINLSFDKAAKNLRAYLLERSNVGRYCQFPGFPYPECGVLSSYPQTLPDVYLDGNFSR